MIKTSQAQNLAKAIVTTAFIAGGTLATASPAKAINFYFSGQVVQVDTSNAFAATPEGSIFTSNVQVGTTFQGRLTYSPPGSANVTDDGGSYGDINPSSGVEVKLGGYTFVNLPFPSTSAGTPNIRYVLADPLNPTSIQSFLSVGIDERSGQLTPETSVLVGTARDSYSGIEGDLINQTLLINSADFGFGSDFVIVGNINDFRLIPEPSSTLGTITLGVVGTAFVLKRKKR